MLENIFLASEGVKYLPRRVSNWLDALVLIVNILELRYVGIGCDEGVPSKRV